jgi:septal ring factor EnvC (AmiA/AmiB activator)
MEVMRPSMSDHDPTAPQPIVLRVEISAEQAASLAPFLGASTEAAPLPASLPTSPSLPMSEEAADARVGELKRRQTELERREAEFEADVEFREDRIERWRTELEELEQTLDRREKDLVSYVDQLQGAMSGTDDAWWSRPAGGDGGVRH